MTRKPWEIAPRARRGLASGIVPRCSDLTERAEGYWTLLSHQTAFVPPISLSLFAGWKCTQKKREAIVGGAFGPRSSFFTSYSITRCVVVEIVIEFWNISLGERYIPKGMVLLRVRNAGRVLLLLYYINTGHAFSSGGSLLSSQSYYEYEPFWRTTWCSGTRILGEGRGFDSATGHFRIKWL